MLIAYTFDTSRLFSRVVDPRLPAPTAPTALPAPGSEPATPTVHRSWWLRRAAAACGSALVLLLAGGGLDGD